MSCPEGVSGGRGSPHASARHVDVIRHPFVPKSIVCLREAYDRRTFFGDLAAGATVAVIALPLSLALAIGSGCKPEQGVFTAIVAGFLISALGGSRIQVGGPAGAFMAIVAGIMAAHGYDGLVLCTLMAGAILIAMGLLRLGSLIKFIPFPVTTGFTSGIAVIIFLSQIKDFFGLTGDVPGEFVARCKALVAAFPTINPLATAFALVSLAVLIMMRKWLPRIPSAIVVVVVGAALTAFLGLDCQHYSGGLETIGTKFGSIPRTLPAPSLPFSIHSWSDLGALGAKAWSLLPLAGTLAVLSAIESLLCAQVADGMIGGRHKSNCELVAQGVASVAAVFFGGMPATGTIARTAANAKHGAKTPVAGMVHSVVLLLTLFLCAPLALYVPLAVLAAILVLVAWNMAEIKHFKHLLMKSPKADVAVLLVSFGLTVFTDLTIAVGTGLVMASLLFVQHMSAMAHVDNLHDDHSRADAFSDRVDPVSIAKCPVLPGVAVYEISGPLFFGAADLLKDTLRELSPTTKVFILRLRRVSVVDASGLHALDELHDKCVSRGITLLFAGLHVQPTYAMVRCGLLDKLGEENTQATIELALNRARAVLASVNPANANPPVGRVA